ncbi:HAMP domain-containing sensor histidine kinase [Pollutibacter soli]|uniref:sensor histidine kinase n=1 Tax=Pollutibacter soli TaxID=3034157 RepID=UPI0030139EE5
MTRLLNHSMSKMLIYAGIVLAVSIPVYYFAISFLWHYELNEHRIILTDAANREDRLFIIVTVTSLTVLFFALMLTGFIILNKKVSERIWQPFYQSLEKIKKFKLTDNEPVLFDNSGISEFNELNQSLQKLIAGNITSFKQQKEFAENASHELQTPLAIVQSKLDLILQTHSLTPEQYDIVEDALTALSRVTRINKNLLILTKIENNQYTETEQVNLSDLLEDTLSDFAPFISERQLTAEKKIDPDIHIEASRTLLEILINNLISNAIRHSKPDCQIFIHLAGKHFSIANTGDNSLDTEQLFRRFASASKHTPGTGLGLSIVDQICKHSAWVVKYNYHHNLHIFSVDF